MVWTTFEDMRRITSSAYYSVLPPQLGDVDQRGFSLGIASDVLSAIENPNTSKIVFSFDGRWGRKSCSSSR
jgi:hypothetical protein